MKYRIDDGKSTNRTQPTIQSMYNMYSMNDPDSIHTIYTMGTAKIPGTMHCDWNITDPSLP